MASLSSSNCGQPLRARSFTQNRRHAGSAWPKARRTRCTSRSRRCVGRRLRLAALQKTRHGCFLSAISARSAERTALYPVSFAGEISILTVPPAILVESALAELYSAAVRKFSIPLGEVADMTRKRRSPLAVPAGSARSKALAGRGVRPPVPKLRKAKRRVRQNRGLEEALLKIAELWHDARTHRRS
jgi:hypothetical protein